MVTVRSVPVVTGLTVTMQPDTVRTGSRSISELSKPPRGAPAPLVGGGGVKFTYRSLPTRFGHAHASALRKIRGRAHWSSPASS